MYKQEKQIRVTPRQLEVVRVLEQRQQWRIGEIAQALKVSSAAATKNVDRLERRGLVTRTQDILDRRAMNVVLTNTGRTLLAQRREPAGANRKNWS